jgi:hypothetical protein
MVERLFRDLTDQWLRHSVFNRIANLIGVIDAYVARHNDPKPFIWKRTSAPTNR